MSFLVNIEGKVFLMDGSSDSESENQGAYGGIGYRRGQDNEHFSYTEQGRDEDLDELVYVDPFPGKYFEHQTKRQDGVRCPGRGRPFGHQRAGQRGGGRGKRGRGGGGRGGRRPSEEDARCDDNVNNNSQDARDQPSPAGSTTLLSAPDTDPEDALKLFSLLVRQFNGRTKLGTLMSNKGQLLTGFTYPQAAAWLRLSKYFRVFEKNRQVKWVSVYLKKARACFNYKRRNTERCYNPKCRFFHICRDHIAGICQSDCGLNHNFHDQIQSRAVAELQNFENEEIRIVFFRSTPVVCDKFNTSGCNADCPDVHVCAKFITKNCEADDCRFGHALRETDHNNWVLCTLSLHAMDTKILKKAMLVLRKETPKDNSQTSESPSSAGNKNQASDRAPDVTSTTKSDSSARKPQQRNKVSTDSVKDAGTGSGPEASGGKGSEQQAYPASHYAELCERYTWEGRCGEGRECVRYHHPERWAFVWQLHLFNTWHDLSRIDCLDLEERYCALAAQGYFEVILASLDLPVPIAVDFNSMKAYIKDGSETMEIGCQRWSTPSYVSARGDLPHHQHTQWTWYHQKSRREFVPFEKGALQYTLEEKYLAGQDKYYFEASGDRRFAVAFKDMTLEDLNLETTTPVLRRPFFTLVDEATSTPQMSSSLLSKPPRCHHHSMPSHWCCLDHHQDFELVELQEQSAEYNEVMQSFLSTMRRTRTDITHIFRIQNPSLWDKFCSVKRSMAPRDGRPEDVDERRLFHGTPTLLGARGICTNSMDFRRAGQNVGARYGRGAYFSTTARYSHNYTSHPHRYMFLAKVLVGEFTQGHQSYTTPPVREGLKLYNSCVDDEMDPNIFVIFDLAQSYPEYLIQYTYTDPVAQTTHQPAPVPTGSTRHRVSSGVVPPTPRTVPRQPVVPPSTHLPARRSVPSFSSSSAASYNLPTHASGSSNVSRSSSGTSYASGVASGTSAASGNLSTSYESSLLSGAHSASRRSDNRATVSSRHERSFEDMMRTRSSPDIPAEKPAPSRCVIS